MSSKKIILNIIKFRKFNQNPNLKFPLYMNSKTNNNLLKKGHPEEILIEINEEHQNFPFFKKFLDIVLEEKFLVSFTPLQNPNLIKIFLSFSKLRTKKKKNIASEISERGKSPIDSKKSKKSENIYNKTLGSLFLKYSQESINLLEESKFEKEKEPCLETKNKFPVIDKKDFDENYVLRLNLLFIDQHIFSSIYHNELENINDDLIKIKNSQDKIAFKENNVKFLIVLEGIQSFFSSANLKKKMERNLKNPFQTISSQEEKSPLTEEAFQEWLCDVNVLHEWEYELTEKSNESLEYIKKAISSIDLQKYKNINGANFGKENIHTEKSKISGFDNEFSLMWIDILMGIPGVSEDKAIAIAKSYPSLKSLMNMIEANSIEEAENILKNLQIYYNYNKTKSKNLGAALASKILKVFTETDPNGLARNNE